MFWVKDTYGNLINMSRVKFVEAYPPPCDGGKWEVRAGFSADADDWAYLCIGTREECGRYRDMLFEKLRTHQSNLEVLD